MLLHGNYSVALPVFSSWPVVQSSITMGRKSQISPINKSLKLADSANFIHKSVAENIHKERWIAVN